MFVCCASSSVRDEVATRSEASYRVRVSNHVWPTNLNNEAAWALLGL
jgi:hypothetical protein